MRAATLAIASATLALAGCAADDREPAAHRETIKLETDPNPEAGAPHLTGDMTGILRGDEKTGCVWLEPAQPADDAPGGRLALVWPAGYYAKTGPVEVFNESGNPVARVGDSLFVGGGTTARQPDRCNSSKVGWGAVDVEVTKPATSSSASTSSDP